MNEKITALQSKKDTFMITNNSEYPAVDKRHTLISIENAKIIKLIRKTNDFDIIGHFSCLIYQFY